GRAQVAATAVEGGLRRRVISQFFESELRYMRELASMQPMSVSMISTGTSPALPRSWAMIVRFFDILGDDRLFWYGTLSRFASTCRAWLG
ncbi:hypothetical protein, partial [Sphingomonas sp.]|uniref:hypothetical protein n=1 Tax=Sphingomonas sp. TaxID=28214 RepID=UPI0025FAFC1B